MEERILGKIHRQLLKKSRGETQVSVGDVVVVHDESLPRGFRKLGYIQNLMVGRVGKTRGVTVKVAGKNQLFNSLNRPLQLLCPLEIHHPLEPSVTPHETKEQKSLRANHVLSALLQRRAKRGVDSGLTNCSKLKVCLVCWPGQRGEDVRHYYNIT